MDKYIPKGFRRLEAVFANEGSETLLIPDYGFSSSCWENTNVSRWLRSMHFDNETERIVSCGFPKFMNLGEGSGYLHFTEQELLERDDIVATIKHDGVLIIRYVKGDKVYFRTRGAHGVKANGVPPEHFNEFFSRYPDLKDPTIGQGKSLLFEWVTPQNQIVIPYNENELYLVGAVDHSADEPWYHFRLKLLTIDQLIGYEQQLKVPLTRYFRLGSRKETQELIKETKERKDIEGYVLRFYNEQLLVKVKTPQYFLLHGVRFKLSNKRLIESWLSCGRPPIERYRKLTIDSIDFEGWMFIEKLVHAMYKLIGDTYDELVECEKFVNNSSGFNQKKFATAVQAKFPRHLWPVCFLYRSTPGEKMPDKWWKRILLDNLPEAIENETTV